MSLPKQMRAVVHAQDDKNVVVRRVPVPVPERHEALVRVHAIGLNPTDYKHAELFSGEGDIMGCDFAGEVVATGSDVPSTLPSGERVFGFVRGGLNKRTAAFAEYVALPFDNLTTIPPNVSYQQAATLPIPAYTAIGGLFLRLDIPEQQTSKPADEWLLVWSAASAVGQYVVQFAKFVGLKIVATASESNWKQLQTLGADVCLDYKDADIVSKIRKSTNGTLRLAFDCFAMGDSLEKICASYSDKGGRLTSVLFPKQKDLPRQDIKLELNLAYSLLQDSGTASFGDNHFKCTPEEHDFYVQWHKKLTQLLANGTIKPIPLKSHGSLDDVSSGMYWMAEGKNRGYKIVFNVAE